MLKKFSVYWAVIAACCLALSLGVSCGESSRHTPSDPAPAPVVPRPDPNQEWPRFASPTELKRTAGSPLTSPLAFGSDFDQSLPHHGASISGRTLQLSTDFTMETWETQYVCFRFALPGFDGEPVIQIAGENGSVHVFDPESHEFTKYPGTWLGLANWDTGRWDWLPVESYEVRLASLSPYLDDDGSLILTWLRLNQSYSQLWWLRVGESPWQMEDLPSGLRYAILTTNRSGEPVIFDRDDSMWQLLTRNGAGWDSESFETAPGTTFNSLAFSPADEPRFLVNQSVKDTALKIETILVQTFTPGMEAEAIIDRSYALTDPPPPGGAGNKPYIRRGYINFTLGGSLEAAFYERSGWQLAWQDSQGWTSTLLPDVPRYFGTDPAGRSWVVAVEGAGWGDTLCSLVRDGEDWIREELPGGPAAYWDAVIIGDQAYPEMLVTVLGAPLRHYTRSGAGDWSYRELPEPAGQHPVHIEQAVRVGSEIRLIGDGYSFTASDDGVLTTAPIESAGISQQSIALDINGKLHQIGKVFEGNTSRWVYMREP